jgi:pantetheine-phosphate adenylyltransferase
MSGRIDPGGTAPRTAVFPGSFDPPTNGHVDLIGRAARLFDRLVVAVLVNEQKTPLLAREERLALLRTACRPWPSVEIDAFDGLLVEYARRRGATAIVRGLRAAADFEYEYPMALMNRHLDPSVETLFMLPAPEYAFISSRLVKEVFSLGGSVRALVPPAVADALEARRR